MVTLKVKVTAKGLMSEATYPMADNKDHAMQKGIQNEVKRNSIIRYSDKSGMDIWDEVDRSRRGMHSNLVSVDCEPMVYDSGEVLPVSYERAWRETYA